MEPSQTKLTLTERELAERLTWFTHVRWVMGAGALLALLVSWYMLGVRFHRSGEPPSLAPAAEAVMVIFLYNAVFTFLVHIVRVREAFTHQRIVALALGQLLCDLLAVCVLVHLTGGIENYFLILILLPLVIATELLPRALAYMTAAVGAIMVNAMVWGQQQGLLRHVHPNWAGESRVEDLCRHADAMYVLEVSAALTIMMFVTVFIASSISQRLRQREAQLEDTYRRLAAADETKSFFMRKAGHDLHAPLAAIHGILGAVNTEAKDLDGQLRRLLLRATRRTESLMDLVRDLRRYSRLQSGDGVLQISQLSLSDLVSETIELFLSQARAKDLTIDSSLGSVRMEGDEGMLREVVTNLVSNAIKYTPDGGRVDIQVRLWQQQVRLRVLDTGMGISPAACERIFEDFYRAPEAKRLVTEGTGLGLAITRRIVEMHAGRIEVASEPERGSTFTVFLPVRKPRQSTASPRGYSDGPAAGEH